MAGKLKILFGEVLRSFRKLWLEMMGALFLALCVMFTLNTVAAYQKTTESITSWDWHTGFSVFGSGVFSVLMLGFSIQSFLKARKIRS